MKKFKLKSAFLGISSHCCESGGDRKKKDFGTKMP